MNVGELKEKIKDLPDTMTVVIEQINDEFNYSLCETAQVQDVIMIESEENEEDRAVESCLVISDDL